MIKIATAQIDVIPGNIRENWKQIEEEIERARKAGAHMLVLPEMCLTGYLIGDLWDQNAFLRECEAYNERIAAASRDITILWGSCAIDWKKTNDDGRPRKYNAAFAAASGHFLTPEKGRHPFVIKTLLPNYRCFDDRRYFTSLRQEALEEGLSLEEALTPFLLPAGAKPFAPVFFSAKTAGMKTTAFPPCPFWLRRIFPFSSTFRPPPLLWGKMKSGTACWAMPFPNSTSP